MKRLLTAITIALMAQSPMAFAQDLTVTWADDSTSDVGYDPRVTQSRHEEQVIVQIFDQLVAADAGGKLYPGLATEWSVSDDNKSVTLKLRDDVTFHDGTPFNAEAVKFTFDTIVDPATGSQGAVDLLGPYAGSEVLGPNEIRIDYKRPFPGAIASFSETELSPVSPSAVEKLGNTGFAQAPVGTGPFRFESWDKGDKVTLVRNGDYNWAPEFFDNDGPSKVSKIVHRYIKNAGTRVAALETGEIDIADLTPPLDMRRLGDSDDFKTVVGVAAGVPFSVMLNTSHGPLQDIAVRRALFHSLDRPQIASNMFFGMAKPAYGPISSATPAYWKGVEDYYPYDPDAAAALLDGAGWTMGSDGVREKDGEKLSIHYISLLEPDTAVAMQAKAREVGIDLAVEIVTKARQDELILTNNYHMGELRWVFNSPSVLVIPFSAANIPEPGKFKFNWMHWDEPKLEELLADAAMATTEDEMVQLYADAQKMIMEYAAFIPVHDQVQSIAHNASIEGLRFAPGNWQVRLYDVRPAE